MHVSAQNIAKALHINHRHKARLCSALKLSSLQVSICANVFLMFPNAIRPMRSERAVQPQPF